MTQELEKRNLQYTLWTLGLTALVGGAMFGYRQDIYGAGEKAWSNLTNLIRPNSTIYTLPQGFPTWEFKLKTRRIHCELSEKRYYHK